MTQVSPETPEQHKRLVKNVFQEHPRIAKICGHVVRVEGEGGLTNRVLRLKCETDVFYLRVPSGSQPAGIDRLNEANNIAVADQLGLAISPLYFDVESGVLLTRGLATLAPDPSRLAAELGSAVGKLHVSGASFSGCMSPFAVAQEQRRAGGLQHVPQADLDKVDRLLTHLPDLSGKTLVPCHCDLSPGNCLVTGEKLWLIDWEYSAMSDPAWDLAYAIVENGLSSAQEARLLAAYSAAGADSLRPTAQYLSAMKIVCDVISALWALAQAGRGRDADHYLAFARERMNRADQAGRE